MVLKNLLEGSDIRCVDYQFNCDPRPSPPLFWHFFVLKDLTTEGDAGGPDAERPPEAGGGSSSMTAEQDDAMETVA